MVMTTTLAEYHSIDLWLLHYESFPLADWEQEFGSEKVHSHLTLVCRVDFCGLFV